MTVAKLKPCPFCGSSETTCSENWETGMPRKHFVECVICGAQSDVFLEKANAVFVWNRRPIPEATPAATQGEVEAVAYALGCSWWNRMSKRCGLPDEDKDRYIRAEGAWAKFTEDATAAITAMPKAQPAQSNQADYTCIVDGLSVTRKLLKEWFPDPDTHQKVLGMMSLLQMNAENAIQLQAKPLTEAEKTEAKTLVAKALSWHPERDNLACATDALSALLERFTLTRKP